jgi:transposase
MLVMKAYSMDLRKRVLAVYDSGKCTLKQVAEQFQVTTRWIQQLMRRRRLEGTIAPYPQNQGRKPAFRGKHLEELNEFVKRHPDATLEEIKEHFAGKITCSHVAIHYTLKRLGWRYKKKRYVPVNKAEKMWR